MGLKKIILDCIRNSDCREDLEVLINLCHGMALSYLRMKASSNKLYMIRGEKLEDLAWDFIADLFEKDNEGKLIKLREYFDGFDLQELSNAEIETELRKLVFTKVEDNIFRAIGEKDPSLRKIIRNLKLAVGDNDCKNRVCYQDGYIIIDIEENLNLPLMPSEFMQIKLSVRLEEKMQIPEILIEVIDILKTQDLYQKKFSLVALATIIRETFVHFNNLLLREKIKPKAEIYLLNGEFEDFLTKSVETVKTTTGIKYVEKGKISEDEMLRYINAARDIVRDYFMDGHKEFSQFEYLKDYMPQLSYSEFRETNRQILEYIVKLIRRDLVDVFKDEWH